MPPTDIPTGIATLPPEPTPTGALTLPPPATAAPSALCLSYAGEDELAAIFGAGVRLITTGSGLAGPGHLYCDYVVAGFDASKTL